MTKFLPLFCVLFVGCAEPEIRFDTHCYYACKRENRYVAEYLSDGSCKCGPKIGD